MSRTIPLPMTPEMFDKFDDSTIRTVWKGMRELIVPEISVNLAPIPYIDSANYFDLLNIFAESSENVLDKAMKILGRARKYQYVAKLKEVVNFTTSDSAKIRQMVSVAESKMYTFRPVFESIVEGSQGDVSKMYFFRAENIKLYVVRFLLDKSVGVAIDRLHPGLEKGKRVLMISEVCCAERAFIRTRNGGPDDVHEWTYQGPVPLAFGAMRLKLDKAGVVQSTKLVTTVKLVNAKRWMAPRVSHPPFCPVLQVVWKDKFYSVDRRFYEVEEGGPDTSLGSGTVKEFTRTPRTAPPSSRPWPALETIIKRENGGRTVTTNPIAYTPPLPETNGNIAKPTRTPKPPPTLIEPTNPRPINGRGKFLNLPPTKAIEESPRNKDIVANVPDRESLTGSDLRQVVRRKAKKIVDKFEN